MSAVKTSDILKDLAAAMTAAWAPGGDSAAFVISPDDPRLAISLTGVEGSVRSPGGWGVIDADTVLQSFSALAASVNTVNQENGFTCIGNFAWPASPNIRILDEQVRRANDFIAQIQKGPNFGTGNYGYLPLVTKIDYSQKGNGNNRIYQVRCVVSIVTRSPHH